MKCGHCGCEAYYADEEIINFQHGDGKPKYQRSECKRCSNCDNILYAVVR